MFVVKCVCDIDMNITCTWGHYSVCKSGLAWDRMCCNFVQFFFFKKLIKKLFLVFLVILQSDLLDIFNEQRYVWVISLRGKFNTSVNSRTISPQKTSNSVYSRFMYILYQQRNCVCVHTSGVQSFLVPPILPKDSIKYLEK